MPKAILHKKKKPDYGRQAVTLRCNICKEVHEGVVGTSYDHTHTQMHFAACETCGFQTAHTIINSVTR